MVEFSYCACLFFHGVYINGIKVWVTFATRFLPSIQSHCFELQGQVASIFTFLSHVPVKYALLKCLRCYGKKKWHENTVVRKLQGTVMYGPKKDAQLEPCIVDSVSISPQLRGVIWVITLLRSTALQNMTLLSCVNFVTKSFQDFTLYDNINLW